MLPGRLGNCLKQEPVDIVPHRTCSSPNIRLNRGEPSPCLKQLDQLIVRCGISSDGAYLASWYSLLGGLLMIVMY